jgi:uncharacterized membrane protein YkvA (DUF1232 family)
MKLEKITGGASRTSPEAFEACVRYWAERVAFGRRLLGSAQYHEVRYEDLVADPERTLRALLAFAGLPWDAGVLLADQASPTRDGRPIYGASAGRWRRELCAAEGEIVERHAGRLLRELGYTSDPDWARALPRARSLAPIPPDERRATRPASFGERLKALRREAVALGLALRDGQTPVAPRLVGGFAALYAVSPVDLIADSRPAVGYLDDLAVVALAVPLMLRLVPAALRTHHRARAALLLSRRTWAVGGARRWTEPLARAWTRLRGAAGGPGYVVDAELRFVSVNAAALGAWGKGPDEVLGRRILEVFPGAAPESYRAHLEALRTARAQRVKTHSRLYDRPLLVDIRPLSDGLRVQFALAA